MIPLCKDCVFVTKLDPEKYSQVDESFKCALCFGILSDAQFRQKITEEVDTAFKNSGYDGQTVLIAVNVPPAMFLREFVISELIGDAWNDKEMGAKNLFANLLQKDIERGTGLRGSLNADLILTITLENDEFKDSDVDYLTTHFTKHFLQRKRKNVGDNLADSIYTRVKITEISTSMTKDLANKYQLASPTMLPKFSVSFERDKIYIGGRYNKYSRALPQSIWTVDLDVPPREGNSVSEKIGNVMKKLCKADDTRFMSSGREDIDVRMLGNGRPFAIQIINAQIANCFKRDQLNETLKFLQNEINKDPDVHVNSLAVVNAKQAEKLNVGDEEKRKFYSALCFSTVPLTKEMLRKLELCTPLTLKQNTVIRVLKRRPLHERPRVIYSMRAFLLNEYHFMLKLETQAGTYIKEFVHGDFGRTTPSAGEVMGIGADQVDILELDVEAVDLEWPPNKAQNGNRI